MAELRSAYCRHGLLGAICRLCALEATPELRYTFGPPPAEEALRWNHQDKDGYRCTCGQFHPCDTRRVFDLLDDARTAQGGDDPGWNVMGFEPTAAVESEAAAAERERLAVLVRGLDYRRNGFASATAWVARRSPAPAGGDEVTRVEMLHWSCDRCDATTMTEAHKPNGEAMPMPAGWLHLDVRHRIAGDGYLCADCAESYRAWWSLGEVPR